MRTLTTRRLLVGLAATAAMTATTAYAAPVSVTITSPTAGTTVSRAAEPAILVTGTAAFGTPAPEARTFYLRGSGCGATEDFWLSTETATDEYDGCGAIGGVPANELIWQFGGSPMTFSARDGVPAVLDASKNVTGTIRAESWTGDGTPGVGQVQVEVSLSGLTAEGEGVMIGSASLSAMNTGADGVQLPFTLPVADDLDSMALSDLTLSVEVHGANYNSSNLGLSGDSKFVLPVFDTGSVLVSDVASFSRNVRATILPDGSWEAELATPNVGNRAVYARALQGGSALTTSVPIVVKP